MRIGGQAEERNLVGVPSESSDKWESLKSQRTQMDKCITNAPVIRNQNQESQIYTKLVSIMRWEASLPCKRQENQEKANKFSEQKNNFCEYWC